MKISEHAKVQEENSIKKQQYEKAKILAMKEKEKNMPSQMAATSSLNVMSPVTSSTSQSVPTAKWESLASTKKWETPVPKEWENKIKPFWDNNK